jgi:hypothetical protein
MQTLLKKERITNCSLGIQPKKKNTQDLTFPAGKTKKGVSTPSLHLFIDTYTSNDHQINFPCPVLPCFASFSLCFNCCNSKSCLSFFSISTNSCLTASTQTSMTSEPTLQVRKITPSLSMMDFALAHLLFHSSSFLLRMGPPSGSRGSWKEESFHAPLRRFVA